MKITVSRSLLSDALNKVRGLAAGKASLPILSNVKLEAKEQKVKFTTTDLDLTVVNEITCHVIEEGAVTLPAKLLSDIIARSAEGDVVIDVEEASSKATIRAGSSTFKVTGLPAADFPMLPEKACETEFVIPQEVLKGLFRRTSYAMSQDDTRRTLKSIHVSFAEGFLTCVATDGRRMAIAEYHPEEAYSFSLEFSLPARTVQELAKSLGNTGDVKIQNGGSQIVATLDNGIVYYSKLLDDAYPNYKQVIPKDNNTVIEVDREAFASAIERVGIFSEAQSMKFEFATGEVKLLSSTDIGNGEESVPVKYVGDTITTTFNHAYILDVLKSIDDDEVKLAFADGTKPVVITSSAPGLALVMPLRIN